MTPDLPAELRVALNRKIEGLSRTDAARRARLISEGYRGGGNSKTIKTQEDALVYALARMPATYAAVAACLNTLAEARPDFSPASLLDVGSGPGTAAWAASQAFPSLIKFTLLDSNDALRELASEFARSSTNLSTTDYRHGDGKKLLDDAPPADFVTASYFIGELNEPERANVSDQMWAKTREMLLIVEPGTPAGFDRIIQLRERLIVQGAHVVAPCPHDKACPLIKPDWCHFAQRLARSRAHRQLKGAELPFEDEKFSYVVLSRTPTTQHRARVLAQPKVSKIAVTMKLCTATGIENASVPHRDKANYSRAKKLNWGNAADETSSASE